MFDIPELDLANHEIPYDTVMKSYLRPLCLPFERIEEARPLLSARPLEYLKKYTIYN